MHSFDRTYSDVLCMMSDTRLAMHCIGHTASLADPYWIPFIY